MSPPLLRRARALLLVPALLGASVLGACVATQPPAMRPEAPGAAPPFGPGSGDLPAFVRDVAPFPVLRAGGAPVPLPFTGGFFEPRPQLVDLTGDGRAELVLNVGGASLQVFARADDGTWTWREDRLGDVEPGPWAVFGDVTGDGLPDLLTRGAPGEVRFYRNEGTAAAPRFALAAERLLDAAGQPVAVEDSSQPVLADVDGDGRLDLLAGKADLGTITLYRHDGLGPDGQPRFAFVTDTFQDIMIYEDNPSCGDRPMRPGMGVPGGGPRGPLPSEAAAPERHGANAMAMADVTGNGLPDLFWGDFFTPSLFFFRNDGTPGVPAFTLVSERYPAEQPVETGGYNAPAFGDVRGDGRKDLFVGVLGGLCARPAGWVSNLLHYENTGPPGQPRFRLRTERLLESVDVGRRSTVAVADLDGDGLPDLVLGNEASPENPSRATLTLYRNVGAPGTPRFQLADGDWLGLAYDFGAYAPVFGDLTGNGLPDLLVGGFNGRFAFLRNEGTATAPRFEMAALRFENINVGQFARGTLGDLTGNGLLDLLAGASNGRLLLYRNVGTREAPRFLTEPNGQPVAADLAYAQAIGLPASVGQDSAPHLADLDGDGRLDLLVGTGEGAIRVFRNEGTSQAPRFAEAAPVPASRRRTAPAAADLTGDGRPEILAGTSAGGLLYWRTAP
ncbi:MAG: FG-GAP repeat domain-containing protein [Rubricoccaceae bacterium]